MSEEKVKKKRFLFVDDDENLLKVFKEMFLGMAKGRWEIATAQNHRQALRELESKAVDVVVLDFNMPVMDGIEFLRLLRRTHPAQKVVMLSAQPDENIKKTCSDLGAVLFLQKLFSPEGFESVFVALDSIAQEGPQSGFRGVMRRVGLQDVLQMECLGRKSSVLDVFTTKARGRIFIEDGQIVHAETGSLQGEIALYGLLALRDGEFNLLTFSEPSQRTISGPYEFLLMEAARLNDESGQATPLIEGTPVVDPIPQTLIEGHPTLEQPPSVPAVSIEETVLCSGSGETLYEWQSPTLEQRLQMLSQIETFASQMLVLLPLGRFDRLEIQSSNERIVCQIQPHMRLFVRSIHQT
jgi:CheY-like chemotaxis protein